MRAPSSFHSRAAGSIFASAVARSGAVPASIGCTGRPTSSRTARRPSIPSNTAIRASSPASPSSISARRASLGGTEAARATASVTADCRAPWRRSLRTRRRRKSCSGSVAAANSSWRAPARSACDPAPEMPAIRASEASTATNVSIASAAGGGSSRSAAQPTPSRRWRGSPARNPAPIATSSRSIPAMQAASSSTFSLRDRVAATAADVSTIWRRSTSRWLVSRRSASREPPDELQGHLGHLSPAAVDRERVATSAHLDDLGDSLLVLLLLLEGGVRDRPGHGVILLAGDDEQRSPLGVLMVDLHLRPRVEVGGCGLEQRSAGGGHGKRVVELPGLALVDRVRECVTELLVGERNRAVAVGRVGQHRAGRAQRRHRQRQHAAERRRIDRHRGGRQSPPRQDLGQQAAERVADHDRLAVQLADYLCEVVGDVADGLVGKRVGVRIGLGDGLGVVGPARRERGVARRVEHLSPAVPAARKQPQPVYEYRRNPASRIDLVHVLLLVRCNRRHRIHPSVMVSSHPSLALEAPTATLPGVDGPTQLCPTGLALAALAMVVLTVGCGSSGTASTPSPSTPATIAQQLTSADAALRPALDRWQASDPKLASPPPAGVLTAAGRERQLV